MSGVELVRTLGELTGGELVARYRDAAEHAFSCVDRWLREEGRFFEWRPQREADSLAGLVERLAYFNCQIWSYEDDGRREDPALVVSGWRGAQVNNQGRNETINEIDDCFRPMYREGAALHSETVGSILDRVSILCIKWHKFAEVQPARSLQIEEHLLLLTECGAELVRGIAEGRLTCLELPRIKLYFDGGPGDA